jgi:hypothetical protein
MHNVVKTITGAFGRALCAIPESRHKQIDHRIATLLSRSGGRLTDNLEREIFQQILDENPALAAEPVTFIH